MATVRKTITLTAQQDKWVKAQIARGDFTNDSEYIRDLIRRDQEQHTKLHALRDAIQEGFDSGVSEKTLREILSEAERLARVTAMAQRVWEDEDKAREFLLRPHPELGGRRPVDVASTELGAREVEELMHRGIHGLPV